MYLLIGIGRRTTMQKIDEPKVPEGFVGPGEMAFVVEALDVQIGPHSHQMGVIPVSER